MSNMSKSFTYVFAILLSFAMVASLILPLLTSGVNQAEVEEPTPIPTATIPPPIEDLGSLSFDQTYLHPSGLFTVAMPDGWSPSTTVNNSREAVVNLNNGTLLSVIEAQVINPSAEYATAEDLNNLFTVEWLEVSWQRYSNWDETRRVVEDDRLVMDFNLTQGQREYIGRQVAWTDGEWVYAVRVVTLDNASEMLQYILNQMIDSMQPLKEYDDTPFEWTAYFDTENRHLIRFPATMAVTDAAPGNPTTVSGDDMVLRIESGDETVADADAAEAWVKNWRSDATIKSVTDVEQHGVSGYAVSYTLTNLDGGTESGLAVLLNGEDTLHVANMRVNNADVDLNEAESDGEYGNLLATLGTFSLQPDLEIPPTLDVARE